MKNFLKVIALNRHVNNLNTLINFKNVIFMTFLRIIIVNL